LSTLRRLKARVPRMPLVVAGCVPQADRNLPDLAGISVVGVQQIDNIVAAVEGTLQGSTISLLGKEHAPRLDLPKLRRNRLIEIIPISLGCLGACTYCKTKHSRGHLRSYLPEEILARVRRAIASGAAQIWITSEDSGAYGKDIGTDLPSLLRGIIAILPERVMLRIGMANPQHILEHLDAMADILNHPQVFSFIHLPVQSGSDRVLRAMKRGYTVAEFQRAVDTLTARVPGLLVATDIICGFPGETREDFCETLKLVERNAFPIINVSQFYPRPGTPAARMRRVPTEEVKRRSTELTRLFKAQRPYEPLVGTRQRVWICDVNEEKQMVGYTKSYALVFLPYDELLLGRSVAVRIIAASKHCMHAEIAGELQHP
jgi:threonylcarbamoyladenosine tRNA methylthiotransferase CDKAL1